MIEIKATIKGEPDVPSFTKLFDYDEQIFFSSAAMVEEKIRQKMKVNVNESLMAFCAYVIKSVRAGRKNKDIEKGISGVLSADNVMIGVPETLQAIAFEIRLDRIERKVVIRKPLSISSHIMPRH